MKIRAYAAVSLLVCAASADAQYANVIISGEIKPGVYGRVEIGNAPPPVLVYPQPVVIVKESRVGQPVYLHVPPGHAKKWSEHCYKYNAGNRPVYFVKSREYDDDYQPANSKGKGKGHAKGHKD
jgi:hypothetical protein